MYRKHGTRKLIVVFFFRLTCRLNFLALDRFTVVKVSNLLLLFSELESLYSALKDNWGLDFMRWDQIVDPEKDYIKNNTVKIRVSE